MRGGGIGLAAFPTVSANSLAPPGKPAQAPQNRGPVRARRVRLGLRVITCTSPSQTSPPRRQGHCVRGCPHPRRCSRGTGVQCGFAEGGQAGGGGRPAWSLLPSASPALTASDLSFPLQLLNSLSVDPDAECKHGLYFRDGRRKVDYILVYHPKRPSGSRTLARRVQHSDAAPATRGTRQDQPLPGKGSVGAAGGPEPPMDYHEDDKRFRREEYEGNLLEAGLELERDEGVIIPAFCGLVGWARRLFPEGGVGRGPSGFSRGSQNG